MKFGGATCSIDVATVNPPELYVSSFMKQSKAEMVKFPGIQQQVLDYLFVEEDIANEDTYVILNF